VVPVFEEEGVSVAGALAEEAREGFEGDQDCAVPTSQTSRSEKLSPDSLSKPT